MSRPVDSGDGPGREPSETAGFEEGPAFRRSTDAAIDGAADRLALIADAAADGVAATTAFVAEGLDRDERVCYVAAERAREPVLEAMAADGVDVAAAADAGALSVHGSGEDGDAALELEDVATVVEETAAAATAADADTRAVVDVRSVAGADPDVSTVLSFAAALETVCAERDVLALCLYDRTGLPPAVVRAAVRTHPLVVFPDGVVRNGYYTPPAALLGPDRPARDVDRMLERLRDRAAFDRSLSDRERELRATKNRLEVATAAGSVGTWTWDVERDRITGDEYLAETFGLDPAALRAGLPLETVAESIHEEDRERALTRLREAAAETGTLDVEFRVRDADGEVTWVVSRADVEYDDGDPVRVTGAIASITARKRRERRANFLEGLSRTVQPMTDADEIMTTAARLLGEHLDVDRCVYAETVQTDRFRVAGSYTRSDADALDGEWPLSALGSAARESLEADEASVVRDVTADDRLSEATRDCYRRAGIESLVCVPQHTDGELTALLVVTESTARDWQSHEVDLVTAVVQRCWESLQRVRTLRELRDTEERLRVALEAAELGTWELDAETGAVPAHSLQHDRIYGYESGVEEWSLQRFYEHVHPADRERVRAAFESGLETGAGGFECRITRADGAERWILVHGEHYEGHAETPGRAVGVIQDVTDRKQYEQTLSSLHEASRDLIQSESKDEASRRTVDAAADLLAVSGVCIYLFDEGESVLRPAAATASLQTPLEEFPTFDPESAGPTWDAFVDGETTTRGAPLGGADEERSATLGQSSHVIPVGDHGLFVLVAEVDEGPDERTRKLAAHLAATTEATLDRIEREASVRAQERELAAQNRRLEALNRVNEIIREIDQVLVQATTTDAIEQAVCELLTQDDRFTFAWIGARTDGALTPRTVAGSDRGYLDAISLATDDDAGEPAVRTAESGAVTLVSNVASALREQPWRRTALSRGLQSVIGIPIQYEGMRYGVLTVYATEADAFDALSRTVLAELGDTIANALNAVETRRALLSDSVVELELAIRAADDPLVALAAETGATLRIQGTVPRQDGATRVFISVSDAAAEAVRDAAAASPPVERVTRLDDAATGSDGMRFEVIVTGSTIPATLVERGAVAQDVRISEGETRAVAELPHPTDVRTFVDRLAETYPETTLVARRDADRSDRADAPIESLLTADLTDRQREVLQTAYLSGYFEWPRDRTGEEVAASLDITQSTFNGHLRAAERKLCTRLFEGLPAPPG
jgi:PAS domain S-box-containing protein